MAYPLYIKDLTNDQKTKIANELTITPQDESDKFLSKLNPTIASAIKANKTPPFKFYTIDAKNGIINVPYAYGRHTLFNEDIEKEDEEDEDYTTPWEKLEENLKTLCIELRDYQKPIIEKNLEDLKKTGGSLIEEQPGAGKTIMATYLAALLGLKFAVLVTRETHLSQWVASFPRIFKDGDIKKDIYVPDQRAKEDKKDHEKLDISKYSSIMSLGDRASSIPLEFRNRIGTLIVDEAHLCCTPSWVNPILSFSPKYIIALTATLERKDKNHSMITKLVGSQGKFVPPARRYNVICYNTAVYIPENTTKMGTLDYNDFCSNLSKDSKFNEHIINFVVRNPKRKFILLTKLVNHAKLISLILNECGVKSDILAGTKKSYTDCRALVGTFSKISVGFDAATFCKDFDGESPDTLILVNTIKNWQNYTQSVGRVMRASTDKTPTVIWMLTRNPVLNRHFNGMKKYIQETSGVIEKRVASIKVSKEENLFILRKDWPGGEGYMSIYREEYKDDQIINKMYNI